MGFAVLLALLLLVNQTMGLLILTVPFYLACLVFFSLGLGWLVSSLNVFLKDVGQAIGVILQLWFYLTPIIYPSSIIPEKFRALLCLNPLYFVTEGYRRGLLSNEGVVVHDLVVFSCLTIGCLMMGGYVFRRLKGQFTEVL
jgi:ABC-type polysaccharide/polyol phosphate export permease